MDKNQISVVFMTSYQISKELPNGAWAIELWRALPEALKEGTVSCMELADAVEHGRKVIWRDDGLGGCQGSLQGLHVL